LAKKVCLVLGNSNENVSITRGIAKTLSEAGAIVYVTETKNNKFVNKLSTVTQQQRSRGVIPIQGLEILYLVILVYL
jgi:enoyl-[acyl-carrier-protein] reductase (NADH)